MALPQTFKAMVVSETAEKTFSREVRERALGDLPAGELIIEVKYSSLNYKDALSATGNKGVTRKYPHTPGIDAAGVVADSTTKLFTVGDQVTVTGFDLGMNTSGGFARYISVPALWATKLPQGLSLKDSMSHGTAGLTAALCIIRLMASGLTKESGEVLVTGASGGVGSVAVAILAKLGFNVVAATGKASEHDFLSGLGAKAIISREEANDTSGRPLQKPRWAGVVDTVGGNILATALKTTKYAGLVAACGNAMSAELNVNVFPFILRGVSLLGVDSVEIPMRARQMAWNKLAGEWSIDVGSLVTEVSLEELNPKIDEILKGGIRGRVLVNLSK
ncbi:MAG TPA: YhdH/YhfP family quinone oxidoreductase [Candidatus Limnocylindrales bacterium]|jgi:acrylyl-CoA reductase (NADPH)|nr:YhdH/YhfP family quinone oxidoreductase [Candidatus Limnocylindrales bacterium]